MPRTSTEIAPSITVRDETGELVETSLRDVSSEAICRAQPYRTFRWYLSVSRVAWNLGDDPWWTLGGGTDAFGAGVGVSLEGGDELGHLLVALDAAE
jgi:hypothetical protein